jgi:replication fork protection complex subunit Csm3/Swi3
MVEKMGHKRQMQIARMEWINEGKPKSSVHEDYLFDDPVLPRGESDQREKTAARVAPIFEKETTERPKTPGHDADVEMDDLYDATPRAARQQTTQREAQEPIFGGGSGGTSLFGPGRSTATDDGPPEDDLDALLAEQEMMQAGTAKSAPAPTTNKTAPPEENNFDDEMEAMAEMDYMW